MDADQNTGPHQPSPTSSGPDTRPVSPQGGPPESMDTSNGGKTLTAARGKLVRSGHLLEPELTKWLGDFPMATAEKDADMDTGTSKSAGEAARPDDGVR